MSEIRTFHHSRKGRMVGAVVWESDEWMDIRPSGEQTLKYASIENRLAGPHPDGDVVRVRKSLVHETTPDTDRELDALMAAACEAEAQGRVA